MKNKKQIRILIIAGAIFCIGFIIGQIGSYQASATNSRRGFFNGYTFRPPYANAEEATIAIMMHAPDYTTPIAIILGVAGTVWLFNQKRQGEPDTPRSIKTKNRFCGNCGSALPIDAEFCPNCGTKIL